MVPLMRRFQRAVFQSASSDLPTSDHNLLSPRPPLLSFGLQVMHLYCASSIPLWCCFNKIPGCKSVAFVPCSMQIGLALICFPVIMVDSSFMEVVLFPKSSLLSPLSLQPIS
ncbi:hypothetical protein Bca4012_052615 [Brassica carinata]